MEQITGSADNFNLNETITKATENAARVRGRFNIIIAGRSGVGKSTLINSVFQGKMAETGSGRPITTDIREITKEGVPMTVFDTRGLEMSAFDETRDAIVKLIEERNGDRDPDRHIHAAWLCIAEDSRRVEDAEIELQRVLAEKVPLIAVITKARNDDGFRSQVQEHLPEARNVVRVRALGETLDDGHVIPPWNLDTLIAATAEIIPEGQRIALAAAQIASLKYKRTQSHKAVLVAATAAAATGVSPIPFSDAIILIPIQIGMVAKITSTYGLDFSTGTLSTFVTAGLGTVGATFAGRTIVSNLLKFIPGGGTIAGGTISAATAAALTTALGEAYNAALFNLVKDDPETQPTPDAIVAAFKQEIHLGGKDKQA